jgi:hypothetical protein
LWLGKSLYSSLGIKDEQLTNTKVNAVSIPSKKPLIILSPSFIYVVSAVSISSQLMSLVLGGSSGHE